MRKILIYPLVLAAIIINFYCDSAGRDFFDPLPYLRYSLKFETNTPLKFKKAPNYFYYSGFRDTPRPNGVIRKNSLIRFFIHQPQDQKISFLLERAENQKKDLALSLYLNENFLKKFILRDKISLNLSLPKKFLNRGINFLRFKVENYNPEFYKRFLTYPEVIFFLKSFKFLQKPDFTILDKPDETKFSQPANSFFDLAVDSGQHKKITFRTSRLKSKSTGKLLIRQTFPAGSARLLKQLIIRPGQRIEMIHTLTGNQKMILEFDYTNKDRQSVLAWEKIGFLKEKSGKGKPCSTNKYVLKEKPHIFLIIIDAAREDIIRKEETYGDLIPNILKFSRHSTGFINFYANSPYTSSSVASMLTGLHGETHTDRGMYTILPDKIRTLPSLLRDLGYHSHQITGNLVLIKHGYQRFFDETTLIRPIAQKDTILQTSFNNLKKAKDIIRDIKPEKPHFLYFHFLPPHAPYRVPENIKTALTERADLIPPDYENPEDNKKYQLISRIFNSYLDNYTYADRLVGGILDSIREKGLYEKSLIIVCSDHGEAFGEHKMFGHLFTVYNEMIKIPFMVKLPRQKEQKIIKESHSLIDLLPGLAQLLNMPEDPCWPGRSIFDQTDSPRTIYSRAFKEYFNCSIIEYPFKFIFYSGREELYNIEADPLEKKNLLLKYPFKSLLLKQKLFKRIYDNEMLKGKLLIRQQKKKISGKEFLKELKTLGYL